MIGRGRVTGIAAATIALAMAASAPAATAGQVRGVAVSFEVRNTNTSPIRCASDGRPYTVRGHLVAPRGALRGRRSTAERAGRTVTIHLYGFDTGEWQTRLRAVPRYDFARRMARLGQTSLTVDMLGYDSSGHPHGFRACTGSQADVTHQLVEALRAGSYETARGNPARFSKVVIAGHDIAGGMAEIVSYAYGDVDGLVILTWADAAPVVGFTPYVLSLFGQARTTCALRPERAEGDSGPGGYHFLGGPDEDFRANLFWDTDPAVIDAALALRNRNPCGYLDSIPPMVITNQARLGEIEVPVLAIMGAEDPVFGPGTLATQRLLYTGSDDVTAITLANAGHFPMLGRVAPRYAELIAGWLAERFPSAGA